MRITLHDHEGYKGGDGVVHHVTEIRRTDGEKVYFDYPAACQRETPPMQHCFYVDEDVTCLTCIARYVPGHVTCHRCRTVIPLEEARIHVQNWQPYCLGCTVQINRANQDHNLVVPQQ